MSPSLLTRVVLVLSGLTWLFVGFSIFFDTASFYHGYNIDVGPAPSLRNELKAPAGALLFAGVLALLGAGFPRLTRSATLLSCFLFLSYGLSRTVSLAFDGLPSADTLVALGTELVLGLLCLWSLASQRTIPPSRVAAG